MGFKQEAQGLKIVALMSSCDISCHSCPFLNGCFPLDSRDADSDRGAIAGNHCRHHSRHQGCTMYIAVPAYFCVYIERRPLELKYCFFFYNQGGRLNTS